MKKFFESLSGIIIYIFSFLVPMFITVFPLFVLNCPVWLILIVAVAEPLLWRSFSGLITLANSILWIVGFLRLITGHNPFANEWATILPIVYYIIFGIWIIWYAINIFGSLRSK